MVDCGFVDAFDALRDGAIARGAGVACRACVALLELAAETFTPVPADESAIEGLPDM